MNLKNLATQILDQRAQLSYVTFPAQVQARLGSDGMQEALRRRWLLPDTESGNLCVNNNLGVIREMSDIAEAACEKCGKAQCECDGKKQESLETKQEAINPRGFSLNHSNRHVHEMAALGSGQTGPISAPRQTERTPAPVVQPNVDANRNAEHLVGEDVMIAEEGKSYQAKIKSKGADGTYELSFGAQKPAVNRRYRKEEMQKIQPGDTQLIK